jgi:hypothetical protein
VCFEISKQEEEKDSKTMSWDNFTPTTPQTRKIRTSFTLNWIQTTNNKLRETNFLQAILDNVNNNQHLKSS